MGGDWSCHKHHKPKFHCYAGRTFRYGSIVGAKITTRVLRFICEARHLIRKQTAEALQYTITILPNFLISYSTVPVDPVYSAVAGYLGTSGLTQVGAAQWMSCLGAITFRVFFSRIRNRIEGWITLLVGLVHDLERRFHYCCSSCPMVVEPEEFRRLVPERCAIAEASITQNAIEPTISILLNPRIVRCSNPKEVSSQLRYL